MTIKLIKQLGIFHEVTSIAHKRNETMLCLQYISCKLFQASFLNKAFSEIYLISFCYFFLCVHFAYSIIIIRHISCAMVFTKKLKKKKNLNLKKENNVESATCTCIKQYIFMIFSVLIEKQEKKNLFGSTLFLVFLEAATVFKLMTDLKKIIRLNQH